MAKCGVQSALCGRGCQVKVLASLASRFATPILGSNLSPYPQAFRGTRPQASRHLSPETTCDGVALCEISKVNKY